MTLWRLFYHVVFVTEDRHPWLVAEVRPRLLGVIRGKAEELGCLVHAISLMPEHVHMAISIPPARSIAAVVGQIKGVSSHLLEHAVLPGQAFAWRRGYGVFSFSERNLPDVVRYIRNQEQHHASGQLWDMLERTDEAEPPPGAATDSRECPTVNPRPPQPASAGFAPLSRGVHPTVTHGNLGRIPT